MKKPRFLFLTVTPVLLTCVISCNDYLYDMLKEKEKPDNAIKYGTTPYDLTIAQSTYGNPPYTITVETNMSAADSPYSTQSYTVREGTTTTLNLPRGRNCIKINGNSFPDVWVYLIIFNPNDVDDGPRATGVPVPQLIVQGQSILPDAIYYLTRAPYVLRRWKDPASNFFKPTGTVAPHNSYSPSGILPDITLTAEWTFKMLGIEYNTTTDVPHIDVTGYIREFAFSK